MYKITITKKETVKEDLTEWKKLSDQPTQIDSVNIDATYGYVTREVMVEKESTVYSQIVDNLNLKGIIAAVNEQPDSMQTALNFIMKGE